ncbi:hypothetical protein [Bifidobacterium aquikefiricola]|uniref:Uncharacterized protein n=2 Tax=Bifidobacterium TaxID=1678 RepID=A0AB39U5G7_9BIFI
MLETQLDRMVSEKVNELFNETLRPMIYWVRLGTSVPNLGKRIMRVNEGVMGSPRPGI